MTATTQQTTHEGRGTLRFQRARKDHECDLCHRKIPANTKYFRRTETNAHGDVLDDWKEHVNCELYVGLVVK